MSAPEPSTTLTWAAQIAAWLGAVGTAGYAVVKAVEAGGRWLRGRRSADAALLDRWLSEIARLDTRIVALEKSNTDIRKQLTACEERSDDYEQENRQLRKHAEDRERRISTLEDTVQRLEASHCPVLGDGGACDRTAS